MPVTYQTKAAITAVGGYVPDYVLSNKMLEQMVDTNDEWIRTRTGIEERRILKDKDKASSFMAYQAVKQIVEKKNIDPQTIDLVICATVTPDFVFPATANLVTKQLGCKSVAGFDIGAACSGFLYALTAGANYINSGLKKVIVIGVDKMSSIIDYQDRNTCIIFGDGAGAVLLEPSEDSNGIQDFILESDGAGVEFLHQKAGGSLNPASIETVQNREHFVYQNGGPVFKMAVNKMSAVSKEIMDRNSITADDVAWLVPHQANKRIIDATAKFAGIPDEKVMLNIQKYGNTTAGTIPLCLWEYEKQLNKGDKLILASFGGGFTWGSLYLTWAY